MRALWEDHVTWTRLAVISLLDDAPDTNATVGRLLRNQRDIGNAIKPFYGAAAGNALTAELRKHILIAADLIAAAKAGDQARLKAEQARWEQNADDIAALLSRANPTEWKRAAVRAMLHEHLRLTTQEVVARLKRNWPADVAAYDRIHRHALGMADTLSTGLIAQFPGRFH
ncbi:MAG: glycosyltransferase [Thermoleophilia bacterium]|nr:glycosyltransferase [Thermoleophilia bacterium]